MKRTGILTHYYNSLNYGGNLQAYALCKYLLSHGCMAEQISYDMNRATYKSKIKQLIKCVIYGKVYIDFKKKRHKAFYRFNKTLIPHSNEVYHDENIYKCLCDYDIFVSGSDQVWNFKWYRAPFFLEFVSNSKRKVSYAASIAMDVITQEQREILIKNLNRFDAISVRENDASTLLSNMVQKDVYLVLDPTLLLEQEEWNTVCDEEVIKEKYIFTYFLGENDNAKRLAFDYSRKTNLKVVNIMYADGSWKKNEKELGDVQIVDAGPEQFLSLIKNAEYIFTDSFHAVVFSFIFKKQFFVFNRDAKGSMNSRITSLVDMFDMQDRFCASKEQEKLEYIESLLPINYNKDFPKFEECRERSYEFIRKNILE